MVQHDMVHYVVETTLGYKDGFYGLLAQGHDIQSFGQVDKRTGKKPVVPVEAIQVECIVELLQTELWDGAPYDDFLDLLKSICLDRSLPAPKSITPEALEAIRREIRRLLRDWQRLPADECIELVLLPTLAISHQPHANSRRNPGRR